MKSKKHKHDFQIDKLTNSIENVITGDSFLTDVFPLSIKDFKNIGRKNGWLFNWKLEFDNREREVYKLIIKGQTSIQGLISLETREDHVYMHLLESSPFNKGKTKVYTGVPGNLVAYACKVSFDKGHEGVISFISKTQLINHYRESLGAVHAGGQLMVIETNAALALCTKYFKT